MIEKIEKIKNLGIYNFENAGYDEFLRYNLFYGFNGSGKSTLSRLFSYIGGNSIPDDMKNFEAMVKIDGKNYKENQFDKISETIKVFNDDFIDENIDYSGIVKSILLLGHEQKVDTEKYKTLIEEVDGSGNKGGLKQLVSEEETKLIKTNNEVETILTNVAKGVKDNFMNFQITDAKYRNYNKTTLKNVLRDKNITSDDILSDDDRIKNVVEITSPKKEKIELVKNQYLVDNFSIKIHYAEKLLKKEIIADVISDLRDDPIKSNWVKAGLNLHKERNSKKCFFCGNDIDQEFFKKMENHFNENLKLFNEEIDSTINSLKNIKKDLELFELPAKELFHESLQTTIDDIYKQKKKTDAKIDNDINLIIEDLINKQQKPFAAFEKNFKSEQIIKRFDEAADVSNKLKQVILEHNCIVDEYEKRITHSKELLEKHFIASLNQDFKYDLKVSEFQKVEKSLNNHKEELKQKSEEIQILEEQLSREQFGAIEFNKELSNILGHQEITLKFDPDKKGYELLRKGIKAKRLSEGEKTAIAFVYFMTKLRENENYNNIIVVIDDPISSFDSNKMFHVYSYIKNNLEDVEQLFLLTHNYSFFSMFHEWIIRRKKKVDGNDVPNYKKYLIDNEIEGSERFAIIKNGGKALDQTSEYDYLFQTLYKYKNSQMTQEEMLFCANSCRRLLESFLSFKFPKQRGDIKSLLVAAINDPYEVDLIYKYINKGSHNRSINVTESPDSNIFLDNDKNMVEKIFDILKGLDETHFKHMEEKAQEYLT